MAQVTSSDDDTDQGFIQHVAPMRLMYLSGHLHPALKIVEDVTKFWGASLVSSPDSPHDPNFGEVCHQATKSWLQNILELYEPRASIKKEGESTVPG